ncbi:alpha/beta fold hydrolase [Pseudoprimorskyibacter insulae]|uniref:AB hydrolase superfamily protein YdjP n=1 Tax=Pseudoprimorskyibacter insulae TaxID=1695997 RepID=A0A2R8APN9_9RHOB|nr:alpha/beta hydrolase [Pseudoprimorskyibacter insulae]SPF77940.1 AB hydrolase superfamily protein YdjP [Pseudoprimorskyibacter insulae]
MSFEQLELSSVALPDGAVITYVREGAGVPLIMIHGVLGDYRSWAPQWEAFTKHYDCLSISCRFSYPNGNTMEAPDHSAEADGHDIAAFMDALGIDKAILVASSYGAFAAMTMLGNHPGRVLAVAAVEPPMMKYAEMFEDTGAVAAAFREATVVPSRAAFERGEDDLGAVLLTGGIRNIAPGDIPEPMMERRRQNIMAGRRVALSSDEFPLVDPQALAACKTPVLLMTGAKTAPIFTAIITGIERVMPQARFEVIDGVGHSVAQEKAEVFNPMVLEFLQAAI